MGWGQILDEVKYWVVAPGNEPSEVTVTRFSGATGTSERG